MKKKIFITMLAVIMLTIFSVTAFAFTTGDINGDGAVKAADARLALRYSARLEELSEEQLKAADVDKSGTVNAADARKILREAAKLTKDFVSLEISGKLVENGVLRVAVCADNPPFAYIENDALKGINLEMARKIADYYDIELKIDNLPEDELIDCIKNNQYDIAFTSEPMGENNLSSQGIDSYLYYHNSQGIWFRESNYTRPSINDLKGQDSKVIGVVENSVADVMVTYAVENGELGNSTIKRYSRYVDGKRALLRRETDAFIGEQNLEFNNTVMYDFFSNEEMLIISSAEKSGLLDSLKKPVNENVVKNLITDFCPAVSDSTISAEVAGIQIAEGGTSIVKINIDSYYTEEGKADVIVVSSSPFRTQIFSKEIGTYKYQYYLAISVPSGAKSGSIKIAIASEPDITCDIPIEVVKDAVGVYNFGTYNSLMPDFGTVIGIAPYEVNVYTRDGNVAYIYSANEIIKAGFTDNAFLEYFFTLMLQQGFVLTEENIGYYTYQLVFTNEYSGEKVCYTEAYSDVSETLELINIFLYHNF